MSEPFLGQIALFGFNFAPLGWATCQGQLLAISQNTALFSILGTTYGGNGTTIFALPNLQGRVAVCAGQGPGLTNYDEGEEEGSENVVLASAQIAAHSHTLMAANANGTTTASSGNQLAIGHGGTFSAPNKADFYSTNAAGTALSTKALAPAGAQPAAPHNNLQPYLTLNYCIALQGVFPPRG